MSEDKPKSERSSVKPDTKGGIPTTLVYVQTVPGSSAKHRAVINDALEKFDKIRDPKNKIEEEEAVDILGGEEAASYAAFVTQAPMDECYDFETAGRAVDADDEFNPKPDYYLYDINEPASDAVTQDDKRLRGGSRQYRTSPSGEVSGTKARDYLRHRLGLGSPSTQPMMHSGFYFSAGVLTDLKLSQIEEAIINSRANLLGRSTNGLAFTQERAMTEIALAEFIIEHGSTNLENSNPKMIADNLNILDLPFLFGAQAATVFNNGHIFSSPCMADNDCKETSEYLLSIPDMFYYLGERVSPELFKAMESPSTKVKADKLAGLIEQSSDFAFEQQSDRADVYSLMPDDQTELKLYFEAPTLTQYKKYTERWHIAIKSILEKNNYSGMTEDQRAYKMRQTIRLARLTELGHFIKRIEIIEREHDAIEDPVVLSREQDIFDALEQVSSTRVLYDEDGEEALDLIDKVYKAITAFINQRTLTIFGTVKVPCKKCNELPQDDREIPSSVIPRDPLNLFFDLAEAKLNS